MTGHTLGIILISVAITFALRALPFLVFSGDRQMPSWLEELGDTLPPAIMAVLIIYCLRDAYSDYATYLLPKGLAVICVIATYKWKHSLLISIVGGTAVYMILLRLLA